jgi:outer membrane protein assembly factor BamB
VFTADNGPNLLALDPATGKTLWHLNIGGSLTGSPMTYELDGRQYLLFAAHDLLCAFALPESEGGRRTRSAAAAKRSVPNAN